MDAGRVVEVLHLPGHTLGHIGLWDEHTRAAIIIDAVLADGIYDRAGNKLIPPRYYDLEALRGRSRGWKRSTRAPPDCSLPCARPGTRRCEWLAIGRAFVDDVERVVREAPAEERDDLWALTQRVDAVLGPFPQFVTELGATVREAAAH